MKDEEEDVPKWCSEIYAKKLRSEIKSLARSSIDIHAWNAIALYGYNSKGRYFPDINGYLSRCESLFDGKVIISLQPLNKYRNDFSRPLPSTMLGVSSCKQVIIKTI